MFRGAGVEGTGHQAAESIMRKEDVPKFLPEARRRAAAGTGGDDSRRPHRPQAVAK